MRRYRIACIQQQANYSKTYYMQIVQLEGQNFFRPRILYKKLNLDYLEDIINIIYNSSYRKQKRFLN